MVSPAAGLTAIKTIPTIELILIVGMVLYIDNEFHVIQILESFYVEIIIFPVIFDGQTPPDAPEQKAIGQREVWDMRGIRKTPAISGWSFSFRNLYYLPKWII